MSSICDFITCDKFMSSVSTFDSFYLQTFSFLFKFVVYALYTLESVFCLTLWLMSSICGLCDIYVFEFRLFGILFLFVCYKLDSKNVQSEFAVKKTETVPFKTETAKPYRKETAICGFTFSKTAIRGTAFGFSLKPHRTAPRSPLL